MAKIISIYQQLRTSAMRSRIQKIGLILSGVLLGATLTVYLPAIADRNTASALPLSDLQEFSEVFGKIKTDYVEPVSDKKLIDDAINGMLTGLDPHSQYLNEADFRDLQDTTQGQFGGLGIEVSMEDGFVKVIAPIEDTPAQKAGIKSGDLIIKIDDVPVKGMTINDAVKRMRGAPDTPIVLTIVRKGVDKPFTVKVMRAIIKVKSVKSTLLEPNYGYVRITEFQEHTGENLAQAIIAMSKENKAPLKGLILDLRNNPGGLLTSAVAVSSAFLPANSLVVYTEGRTADAKMRLTATPEDYLQGSESDYLHSLPAWIKTIPMVVLINAGSASASEIVSGALQDHRRAVLMGTRSFGKGSVQTVLPLGNGTGIKLTTARYFTPNGRSIQAKGIVPDIIVEEGKVVNSNNDGNMLNVHEADLENHLSNPNPATANSAKQPPKIEAPKDNTTNSEPNPDQIVNKNDFQLNQAVDLLKGINILDPTFITK
jgi:carboxyl-terminal processing protease